MKKILLFIIVFLLVIVNVNAEKYYGEYKPLIETTNKIESDDLTKVNVERRYKYYQEKKNISENLYLKNENDPKYPFVIMEPILSDFSSWQSIKPLEKEGRIIENTLQTKYKLREKIRYFKLKIESGSNNQVFINDLRILVFNKSHSYKIDSSDCSGDNYDYLNDSDLTTKTTLIVGCSLIIDLEDYYDPQNIFFEISLSDDFGTEITALTFNANKNKDFINPTYENKINYSIFANDTKKYNFYLPNYPLNIRYEDEILTVNENLNPNPTINIVNKTPVYRYQDTLYKYYNIEREYQEGYYSDLPNYIRDDELYQDYYLYQKRDYIELNDHDLMISNNIADLKLFSNVPLDLINVDYSLLNNTYQLTINYDNISIQKEYIVNPFTSSNKESGIIIYISLFLVTTLLIIGVIIKIKENVVERKKRKVLSKWYIFLHKHSIFNRQG